MRGHGRTTKTGRSNLGRARRARPRTTTRHRVALVWVVVLWVTGLWITGLGGATGAAVAVGDIDAFAGGVPPSGLDPLTVPLHPEGVLATPSGELYIADAYNARIWKRTAGGLLQLVTGNGTSASTGDGGPAIEAQAQPSGGLALDATGALIFTEYTRLRRIDTAGIITTIAGTGAMGGGGDGGPATAATFNGILGLAIDGPMIYVSDSYSHVVRVIDAGGTIHRFAGNGQIAWAGDGGPALDARLYAPEGLAVDSTHQLYIADTLNHRIRKVDNAGTITTVAGNGTIGPTGNGGPAVDAQLNYPDGVAVDSVGRIFIGDAYNHSIRKVETDGTIWQAAVAQLPLGVSVAPNDDVYAADQAGGSVLRIDHGTGASAIVAGTVEQRYTGDGGPAPIAAFSHPSSVAVDPAGAAYIADRTDHRIRKVGTDGIIEPYAGSPFGNGYGGDGGPASQAQLPDPAALAADGAGNVYVADPGADTIRRIDAEGTITTVAGNRTEGSLGDPGTGVLSELHDPSAVATDAAGNVYIADAGNNAVRCLTADGFLFTFAGQLGQPGGFAGDGGAATAALLDHPMGVAVDRDGSVLISDTGNQRVRRVDPGGAITTVAGGGAGGLGDGGPATAGTFDQPLGLRVDRAHRVFVADATQHRVRAFTVGGTITTVAGSGADGNTGDGGPAVAAAFAGPTDVAVTPDGDLLLADPANARVRRVTGAAAGPAPGSGFHPVVPTRVLDSRTALGGWSGRLQEGSPRALTLPTGTVPPGATAVVLNVTAAVSSSPSYLSVYAAGARQPVASNLNVDWLGTVANLVTVPVGPGGQVLFSTALGSVDVVADVVGWYDDGSGPGDRYNPVAPSRLLDSRTPTGGWSAPLGPGAANERVLQVTGGVVPGTATAVVLNVTATQSSTGSFVQVWPTGTARPTSSNLNFGPGETRANLVTVPLGAGGQLSFHNELGTTHLIADVVGYFDPSTGGRFHVMDPTRMLDNRFATGLSHRFSAGTPQALAVRGRTVPAPATAIVANLTATNATAGSFLTVYPNGTTRPATSNVNFAAYRSVPNLSVSALGIDGAVAIVNEVGQADVVLDLVGYYA